MKQRGVGRAVPLLLGLASTLGPIGCGASAATKDTAGEHEAAPAGEHAGHSSGELLVTSPLRMDTELSDDYVAQIHAIQRIELRALEGGYLEEIFVDEGKPVREGQRMFQIKPTLYQAELDMARAEAQAAQIEFTNTELLAAKQVVSANELALAKAKLDKAQAEVALREAHRQFTAINAPFDGIMGLLEVRRGSLLEEGELLTTVSDNRHMWVYFNVTESEYLEYMACPEAERPKEVELILANNQVFDQVGTIETIEADFNNETGTIAFRATFPNPRGVLRHGETGKVRIKTPLKDALVIPQAATFEVLDHRFVFVVDKDGVVHQRRITVAEEVPHLFVVSEGLDEHERILFEGLRKVQDGSHVATKYLDPAELLKQLDLPAD